MCNFSTIGFLIALYTAKYLQNNLASTSTFHKSITQVTFYLNSLRDIKFQSELSKKHKVIRGLPKPAFQTISYVPCPLVFRGNFVTKIYFRDTS